ncbi:MAG: carboxypeptidase regulatory-like domain-containing protein, partial [Thermoanaerobaculales bacterium]|nr:carboxypeptidase regulatory-like domain-containing protein [Thermoanaerobaculales bacterium]
GTFSLIDYGGSNNSVTFSNKPAGAYSVTESATGGWSLSGLQCTDPDGGTVTNQSTRTATIDLDPGENIVCTYTNNGYGSITIAKNADPVGSLNFSFSGSLGTFSLKDDGVSSSFVTFSGRTPGGYSVTEAVVAGWNLTQVYCVDPDGGSSGNVEARTATIDLDPGENITCTYTNVENRAPVAVPGDDIQMPALGSVVTLDGSASYDPEGDALTFSWREDPGNPEIGLIADPSDAVTTFYPQWPGRYLFTLVVNDDLLNSDAELINVFAPGIAGHVLFSGTSIPIAGVYVTAQSRVSTSTSQGEYNLVGTTSGDILLEATDDGLDDYIQTLIVSYDGTYHQIEMVGGDYPFTGTVTNRVTGLPLDQVSVVVEPGSGLETATSLDGTFSLVSVPQGSRLVNFVRTGYRAVSVTLWFDENTPPYELAMDPADPASLSGTVYSVGTEIPLAGINVTVAGDVVSTSSGDGSYNLPGLNTGYYTVVATGPPGLGVEPYTQTVQLVNGANNLDIYLAGGVFGFYGTVTEGEGKSIRAAGAPIVGVQVAVLNGPSTKSFSGAKSIDDLPGLNDETDATGYFWAQEVPFGTRTVTFSALGYETLEVEVDVQGNTEYNVTLIPTMGIFSDDFESGGISAWSGTVP